MTQIELLETGHGYATIPFRAMHPRFGRAEFGLLPRWVRGKLRELWIISIQQENHGQVWHLRAPHKCGCLQISSGVGIDAPRVWQSWWSEVYKVPCIEVYVPDGSDVLRISACSDLTLTFSREERQARP